VPTPLGKESSGYWENQDDEKVLTLLDYVMVTRGFGVIPSAALIGIPAS